jgi:TldD protein
MGRITRRKFLESGAQGVVLATIPGILRFDPAVAFARPTATGTSLADYYSHFGVDEAIIKQVMHAALSKGGEYCDLYFQHTISSQIVLEDDIVSRAFTNVDLGVGIRVLEGDQTGFSFTEEITPRSMELAAQTAANIAAAGGASAPSSFNVVPIGDYYPVEVGWEDVDIDRKIPIMQQVNEKMAALNDSLVRRRVYLMDSDSRILVATSEGRVGFDHQPLTYMSASCTAEKNDQRESGGYSISRRQGIEYYTDGHIDRVAKEAVDRTMILFEAVKPQAGEMPVVLAAGGSGILLHEAIGHGMEGDFNRKNESIFADKIGKKVAEPMVTIIDDGTVSSERGSINIDDEASESQRTVLVQEGILESYMHDRISAEFYGVEPTGNGRRQDFRYPPQPRMRNTCMLAGPHTKEEIISSVKSGVYCDSFTNGEVRIGPGDFTFYVALGYLIEDGKMTAPIKDINLIGNGPDVLAKVTMVADDFEMSENTWTCGKGGQGVPVSMGQPTCLVSSITVGGVG